MIHYRNLRRLTSVIVVLCAACATGGHLRPAREAQEMAGQPAVAIGADSGVRLTLDTDAWRADPPTLSDAVIPLRVTLENGSAHPLRVRYSQFRIRGPVLDYVPLPPRKLVDRTVTVQEDPLLVPRIVSSKFQVAPYLYPNFPGLEVSKLPWENDPQFYTRQYAKWTESLPTVAMIDRALPEGVLEPGGQLSGFLYFEPLRKGVSAVRLDFDLVDAGSRLAYGRIQIPLAVR